MQDKEGAAPLLVFTVHKFPVLPTIRLLKEGDDLEAVLREECDKATELVDQPLDPMSRHLGVLRIVRANGVEAQVHSDPEAEAQLKSIVDRLAEEQRLIKVLQEAGIIGPPREDGCICGHCPLPGQEEAESAVDAANNAEGHPSRWN